MYVTILNTWLWNKENYFLILMRISRLKNIENILKFISCIEIIKKITYTVSDENSNKKRWKIVGIF